MKGGFALAPAGIEPRSHDHPRNRPELSRGGIRFSADPRWGRSSVRGKCRDLTTADGVGHPFPECMRFQAGERLQKIRRRGENPANSMGMKPVGDGRRASHGPYRGNLNPYPPSLSSRISRNGPDRRRKVGAIRGPGGHYGWNVGPARIGRFDLGDRIIVHVAESGRRAVPGRHAGGVARRCAAGSVPARVGRGVRGGVRGAGGPPRADGHPGLPADPRGSS